MKKAASSIGNSKQLHASIASGSVLCAHSITSHRILKRCVLTGQDFNKVIFTTLCGHFLK